MAEDRQALAMQYLQLLQSGVPAQEAFKQVYPKGIPTAAQQQKEDAKAKQGSALAGTGGTIAGLLGIKYGMAALAPEAATTAGAGAAVAVPTGVAGAMVPAAGAAGGTAAAASGGAAASGAATTGGMSALGTGALAGGSLLAGGLGMRDLYTHDRGTGRSIIQGTASGAAAGAGIGAAFGGVGAVPGALIGGAIGLAGGIGSRYAQHESTRDRAIKNTAKLLKASDNKDYQNYISGMREQFNTAPKGPAFNGGQFENFEQYKKAGLNAQDLSGVYGNLKLGEQYVALPQEMKNAYTQSQIDKGNYKSKKGEVQFVDSAAAQADFANFVSGMKPQQAVTRPIVGNIPAQAVPAVSEALAKKQLAQTGVFGNQLLQAINKK